MKRAEIQRPNEYPVVMRYLDIPQPPSKGVVVKVLFCGICHSDVHSWENVSADMNFPMVLGHEVSGQIYSFGPEAGDNVVVYSFMGCGECKTCDSEQHSLCYDRSKEIGCGVNGGYSDYVVVPHSKFLIKVPEIIPMDIACMLPCSGLTSYSAVMRVKPFVPEADGYVMVIGAGGLGLWCLQWIRNCLPASTKIVSADIDRQKLNIALKHGAHDTILLSKLEKGVESKFIENSNGGFDAVLDFVGTSDSASLGVAWLKKNGILMVVGLYGGTVSLELKVVVREMKMLGGSFTGSLKELKDLIQIVSSSQVTPPPVSHHKLEEVGDVWKKLAEGKVRGRALIKHD